MTVTNQTPSIRYVYNGPADFSFSFKVYEVSDVVLTLTYLDGTSLVLIYGTHYTIILSYEGENGGVCTVDAGAFQGYLDIVRKLPRTQDTDWVNNDPFSTEQLEDDLDRLVMLIQEFGFTLDQAAVYAAWKGVWVTDAHYMPRDMIEGPDRNIYTCMIEHQSGVWDTDLIDGNWALMISVGDMQGIQEAAEAARDAAIAAANAAESSAINAANSETAAGVSEANASVAETNAANCAAEAAESAGSIGGAYIEAYNWANMGEDVPVPESLSPPEYSAYHWSKKAEGVAAGGITSLVGTAPIIVTGDLVSKVVSLDQTGDKFVPDITTDVDEDKVLTVESNVPIWKPSGIPTKPIYDGAISLVEGGVYGGRQVWIDDDTLRFEPFSCMSDDLTVQLYKNSNTDVDVSGIGANATVYAFAVKLTAGGITVLIDSNADGSGLTGITHKRFLGMTWSYGGGTQRIWTANGNIIELNGPINMATGINTTTPTLHNLAGYGYFSNKRTRAIWLKVLGSNTESYEIHTAHPVLTSIGTIMHIAKVDDEYKTVRLSLPNNYFIKGSAGIWSGIDMIAIELKR